MVNSTQNLCENKLCPGDVKFEINVNNTGQVVSQHGEKMFYQWIEDECYENKPKSKS